MQPCCDSALLLISTSPAATREAVTGCAWGASHQDTAGWARGTLDERQELTKEHMERHPGEFTWGHPQLMGKGTGKAGTHPLHPDPSP